MRSARIAAPFESTSPATNRTSWPKACSASRVLSEPCKRTGTEMAVKIHTATGALTDAEIATWRAIPVAVAVDLSPESQIDPAIRPINPPGKQPRLFGRAVTVACTPPDFGAVVHALEHVGRGEVRSEERRVGKECRG